ncbi:Phm5 protein [Candida orthopsilosis Co 90-125]|uniref:Endopolyphosphatase n=1 Tax=Candida orthopsilosis (strain 90-125) TaxID=1136231 RepID=H8XBG2_CANO9|nr:Phm5 protein [Candida orthopsilosis Co 90-125]CCG25150.1 Phm5 protein [Candida orthopsilosis Co 90-125]
MITSDEKNGYQSHQRPSSSSWRRMSLSLLSLLLLVPIYQYLNTNSLINEAGLKSPQYISIETIELTSSEKDDLRRLGLTPKKPIKIVTSEKGKQIIHGRFLHITDIHPDPYFKEGSSFDEMCHRSKGNAQKYGDAISGCDSPVALMDDTIKWIEKNLRDKIDFIVWTGDNVRHDNDRNYPRTEQNIFEMNEHVSKLMYETFKKNDTPELEIDLIPSLGNNDVYPHNLFSIGPTLQTRELFQIWQRFIPQSQLHTFNRGAYFFKEVIPGQLAILSINTLYLFQSNPLVDNCDKRKQPGYKLFEWLGYVLKELRARNMKVWLTGHVPPNEKNYDLTCLRKYIVWIYEFRDIIVGGLYGHMNLDHFIPLDSVAAYKSIRNSQKKQKPKQLEMFEVFNEEYYDDLETEALGETSFYQTLDEKFDDSFFRVQGGVPSNKVEYMNTVREEVYAKIKGKRKSGDYAERYSISHVGSSIVPTFNPGLRVWEYNITNLAYEMTNIKFEPWDKFFYEVETLIEKQDAYTDDEDEEHSVWSFIKRDKTFPLPKPKGAKLGPAYIPQTYTPERYVQYYADLAGINKGKKEFDYEIEYTTDDKLYNLPVLTVEEWLKYARKLGKPVKENSIDAEKKKRKKKKNDKAKKGKNGKKLEQMWAEYLKNTFVSSNYENSGLG